MSVQKVIAVENIERGNDIYIDSGLVRVAVPTLHRPSGRAIEMVFKGQVANFDAAKKELSRAQVRRGIVGVRGGR